MHSAFRWLFFVGVGLIWVAFSGSAHAFWTLNTAEIQKNPYWAGEKLVWSDNRLGYEAIFVRAPTGEISPLLAFPAVLVSASESYVQFTDVNSQTFYLNLSTNEILSSVNNFTPNLNKTCTLSDGSTEIVSEENGDIVIVLVPKITPVQTPVDQAPPIIDQVEVVTNVDSVKLHWHTDEKSTSHIALTPVNSSFESVQKTYVSKTYSHTYTISSLAPGQQYFGEITAIDSSGNISKYEFSFTLPSLSTFKANSAQLEPGKKGIWRGKLIAEPNIIAADKAMIEIEDQTILLDWTIGLPPPNLKRGCEVYVYGAVNSGGDKILMHGLAAIEMTDVCFETVVTENLSQNGWVKITGVLTSVAKTGWKIKLNSGEIVEAEWLNYPVNLPNKGDEISLIGLNYQKSSTAWVIAATEWQMIKPVVKKSVVKLASSKTQTTQTASPSSLVKIKLVQQTESQYADKQNQIWYYYALVLSGMVVYKICFLSKFK